MSESNYNKIMGYLDVIEAELNKLATIVGHCSYQEFMSDNSTETI